MCAETKPWMLEGWLYSLLLRWALPELHEVRHHSASRHRLGMLPNRKVQTDWPALPIEKNRMFRFFGKESAAPI